MRDESNNSTLIHESSYSIGIDAARQIATTTKTRPTMSSITPRWLLAFLPWVEVEAGVFRVNQVKNELLRKSRKQSSHDHLKKELNPENITDIEFFSELSKEDAGKIISQMKPQEFMSGSIINEEKASDAFHIILSGKVEITHKDDSERDMRLALLGDGDYFGNIGLGDNYQKDNFTQIKSLGKTKTLSISQEKFSKFLEVNKLIKEKIKTTIENNKKRLLSVNSQGERVPPFMSAHLGHPDLPVSYFDFEDHPYEYHMSLVQTTIRLHNRVSDLYNVPYNQLHEQLRLAVLGMRERQEWDMINDPQIGLLPNVHNSMRVFSRTGSPTPDDMDDLIAAVWKKPAFFLAHPSAIAAFGRECTKRGVPPVIVHLMGSPFMTWRGIPILPTDKLEVMKDPDSFRQIGLTNILLIRVGLENQGVVGLTQANLPQNPYYKEPGVAVSFNGIDNKGCANYLTSVYFSIASLTYDAVAVLQGVQVGNYYDYK
jgi:hypothetical protein